MKHDSASTQEGTQNSPATQILTFLQTLLAADPHPLPFKRKRGHPVTLSHDHLWLAMLTAILRGFTGFASVWRLITWGGVGSFPIVEMTRDGVRKRLLHASLDSLHDLLARVSQALLPWTSPFQDFTLAPFATTILALDQSTLDAVQRKCQDVCEEAKDSPILLVGKLAALFDLRRQQWVRLLLRHPGGNADPGGPGLFQLPLVRLARRSGLLVDFPLSRQDELHHRAHLLSPRDNHRCPDLAWGLSC